MAKKIVPPARPEMVRSFAELLLRRAGVTKLPALLGRRGYYRDTMGAPGINDIGIYDDAIVLVTPTAYATFNANVDPAKVRDGMAHLEAGVYSYRIGIHGLSRPKKQQYKALVQAGDVVVKRDDLDDPDHDGPEIDRGRFGINIHRGGYGTTGSEGCQTIHPDQWPAFIALVESEMKRHAVDTIPYVLTEREALAS
jgi:hypothetical protein